MVVDVWLPFSLCLHSVRDRAEDVTCLREPGAQRYANIYVDRQVGKSIKTLGPSVLIGRTFLGPTPSTEYLNTDKYIYIYQTLLSKATYIAFKLQFYILSALALPGNRTHDLGVASAMLYHLSYRKADLGPVT